MPGLTASTCLHPRMLSLSKPPVVSASGPFDGLRGLGESPVVRPVDRLRGLGAMTSVS